SPADDRRRRRKGCRESTWYCPLPVEWMHRPEPEPPAREPVAAPRLVRGRVWQPEQAPVPPLERAHLRRSPPATAGSTWPPRQFPRTSERQTPASREES